MRTVIYVAYENRLYFLIYCSRFGASFLALIRRLIFELWVCVAGFISESVSIWFLFFVRFNLLFLMPSMLLDDAVFSAKGSACRIGESGDPRREGCRKGLQNSKARR